MKVKIKVLAILISACIILVATISNATSLSMTSAFDTYDVNESFSVDLVIEGLEADQNLGAFYFDVVFDSSILTLDSYDFGDKLGTIEYFEAYEVGSGEAVFGTVNLAELSFLSITELFVLQPDTFIMATLNFTVGSVGMSSISYDSGLMIFSDESGGQIVPTEATGLSVRSVAPVPEPATIFLLGIGLVGLVGSGLRRKKK